MEIKQSNITFKYGSIFNSNAQVITNTINTFGVMGAGLAKQFRERFPEMYEDYKEKCRRKEVKVGQPYLWKPQNGDGKWILNFPTKHHWRKKSRLEWIEEGLKYLLEHYEEWGIQSLAMPALGCDLGGLDWESQVKPLMVRYLSQMNIPVEIYEPLPKIRRKKQKMHKESNHKKRTKVESQAKQECSVQGKLSF